MADFKFKLTAAGRQYEKTIREICSRQISLGFPEGMAAKKRSSSGIEDAGAMLADVALWNEVGTSKMPARPFMASSFENNEKKLKAFCARCLKEVETGATAQDVLQKVGVYAKGIIQQEISDGDFAANAPSTVARKGSDKPLIDTGHMRQSVNFEIKGKE
jgi:hypothetical protein